MSGFPGTCGVCPSMPLLPGGVCPLCGVNRAPMPDDVLPIPPDASFEGVIEIARDEGYITDEQRAELEAELAELRRKAAAWDEYTSRTLGIVTLGRVGPNGFEPTSDEGRVLAAQMREYEATGPLAPIADFITSPSDEQAPREGGPQCADERVIDGGGRIFCVRKAGHPGPHVGGMRDEATGFAYRWGWVAISQPIGACDGSGLYAYDPDDEDGRGRALASPCPGCRACR